MAETLMPTMNLRYLIKPVQLARYPDGVCEDMPVLQQRFDRPNGEAVWHDVPMFAPATPKAHPHDPATGAAGGKET